jgi:DNA polymerase-1
MRELLIDADIFVYKATRLSERETNWGGDSWTLHSDMGEVKTIIDDQIWKVLDKTKIGSEVPIITLCFSDRKNFRKKINPDYKSNRKGGRKPMCFSNAIEYCKSKYNCISYDWLEADDVMGIKSTEASKESTIIVSEDKDLLTIPGLHWDFKEEKIFKWSKDQADYQFFYQVLVGDAVDNYKGCQGIGPISAEKILRENIGSVSDMWEVVLEAFLKSGQGEEEAIINARMARILRAGEFNIDTSMITLWTPEGKDDTFDARPVKEKVVVNEPNLWRTP